MKFVVLASLLHIAAVDSAGIRGRELFSERICQENFDVLLAVPELCLKTGYGRDACFFFCSYGSDGIGAVDGTIGGYVE